jgi:hypothetical protein
MRDRFEQTLEGHVAQTAALDGSQLLHGAQM